MLLHPGAISEQQKVNLTAAKDTPTSTVPHFSHTCYEANKP